MNVYFSKKIERYPERILNDNSYHRNANQNHNDIKIHTHRIEVILKNM
jgi:hypothetical protein